MSAAISIRAATAASWPDAAAISNSVPCRGQRVGREGVLWRPVLGTGLEPIIACMEHVDNLNPIRRRSDHHRRVTALIDLLYVETRQGHFTQGVTEIGCMAHARRKLFDLHASSKSPLAEQALHYIGQLYEVERQVKDLGAEERRRIRQEKAKPLADALHAWMQAQQARVPDGSATAKAFDYSLKRWVALTRYLDDGQLPIDNNYIER